MANKAVSIVAFCTACPSITTAEKFWGLPDRVTRVVAHFSRIFRSSDSNAEPAIILAKGGKFMKY